MCAVACMAAPDRTGLDESCGRSSPLRHADQRPQRKQFPGAAMGVYCTSVYERSRVYSSRGICCIARLLAAVAQPAQRLLSPYAFITRSILQLRTPGHRVAQLCTPLSRTLQSVARLCCGRTPAVAAAHPWRIYGSLCGCWQDPPHARHRRGPAAWLAALNN
jgi:hypothetical protein